jgi:hypothetical protein
MGWKIFKRKMQTPKPIPEMAIQQLRSKRSLFQYWIQRYVKVDRKPGTGIDRMLRSVDAAIAENGSREITADEIQAIAVFSTLHDLLLCLWKQGIGFEYQLKSMNTGSIDFTTGGDEGKNERNFKDFGFEIISAALLTRSGLDVKLPTDSTGNDIICSSKDANHSIEIQCKHPEGLSSKKLREFIKDAVEHAIGSDPKASVVLGLAVDGIFPITAREASELEQRRAEIESALMQEIDSITFPPQLVGIYTLATRFDGKMLIVDGNSTLIVHSKMTGRDDQKLRFIHDVLSCFNPEPSFLRVDNAVKIEYHTQNWS